MWVIESSAQTVCVQTYSLPLPNLHKISAPWSEFRLKLQSPRPVQCHGNFSIRQSISDKCACKSTSPRNFSLKTWPRISVNLHSESEGIQVPNSTSAGICAIALDKPARLSFSCSLDLLLISIKYQRRQLAVYVILLNETL